PSCNVFKPEWLEYIKNRKEVRLCFDNDKAGKGGMEKIVRMAREQKSRCKLSILKWPEECREKYDIGDLITDGMNVVEFTRKHCEKLSGGNNIVFVRGDNIPEQETQWLWPRHIPLGTFVSLSGLQGTHKSCIVRDFAARATAGLPFPLVKDQSKT